MKLNTKQTSNESINDLINIVAKLRDPDNGCPWDIEQTHKSLIPFVLEEAHEVAQAIREGDQMQMKEELGDLLLQVVLHAQIAREKSQFCLYDISQGIIKKLIRRHPHVFQNKQKLTIKEVQQNWERIKMEEQPIQSSKSPISDNLKSKIRSQSAINGSITISNQVAKIGLEWENSDQIWEKLKEELGELKQELKGNNRNKAEAELGDVMFTLINIARWYQLNPEEGLAGTNNRFLDRLSYLEKKLNGKIKYLSKLDLKKVWEKAKKYFNNKV